MWKVVEPGDTYFPVGAETWDKPRVSAEINERRRWKKVRQAFDQPEPACSSAITKAS